VQPEIAHAGIGTQQRATPPGQDDLPTMGDGTDTRRSMDVESYVPFARYVRLGCVQANSDLDWTVCERALDIPGCGDRLIGAPESAEERIPLAVDLNATVTGGRPAHDIPVVLKRLRIAIAEFAEKPRRTLDIAEEERDSARRKVGHRPLREVSRFSKAMPRKAEAGASA
jgi:hypothetical protein